MNDETEFYWECSGCKTEYKSGSGAKCPNGCLCGAYVVSIAGIGPPGSFERRVQTNPKIALALLDACKAQEWSELWKFFNWFASGESQNQYPRAEPMAILGELYQRLAIIDGIRRSAITLAEPQNDSETSKSQKPTNLPPPSPQPSREALKAAINRHVQQSAETVRRKSSSFFKNRNIPPQLRTILTISEAAKRESLASDKSHISVQLLAVCKMWAMFDGWATWDQATKNQSDLYEHLRACGWDGRCHIGPWVTDYTRAAIAKSEEE